ncbi:MAG: glycosyltransferase family 4 protein [Thaumarchaeota archaeon]|nr:glycosyltransferase family 4 protein [Nitrososphaerota archaeon]
MRIAFVSTYKPIGGISVNTRQLSKEFRRQGHEVTVIPLVDQSTIPATGYYLAKLLNGFDIIHVQGLKSISSVISGFLASRTIRGACVCTAHGFTPPYWYSSPSKRYLMRHALRHYDALISVSDFVRHRFSKFVGERPSRQYTVYNGVDIDFFNPAIDPTPLRRRLGLTNKKVVLYVGRLAPRKGVQHLLDAFALAVKTFPELALVICGRGEMEGGLRSQTQKLELTQRVVFPGLVPQEDLPLYYALSDVVAVPSTYEPMGIVPLEAMSAGRPVVASNTGGIPEVVEDTRTGLLVPPGDAPALAEALCSLCADEDLARKLGERGRAAVVGKYTWERIAVATLQAYGAIPSHSH